MNADELRDEISEQCNDVSFNYNGKSAGIFPKVHDSISIYVVCFGDEEKEYSDIDEVMSDKFFDGKSLAEIAEIVQYT
ncbi:MAG: hypothetical protein HFG80_06130 [Eubacterium sp.]|nr:hypothetical protein [Eubacterium sp.]